jgi:hypothetical protein
VNISNDGWYGDSGAYAQHLNQTRMRAIENNRWLLSSTDTGVTPGDASPPVSPVRNDPHWLPLTRSLRSPRSTRATGIGSPTPVR